MHRRWLPGTIVAAAMLSMGVMAAAASSTDTTLSGGDSLRIGCTGDRLTTTRVDSKTIIAQCRPGSTTLPTATNTPGQLPTANPTNTNTPVPPTATRTNTPVPPTPTNTPTPTATPTPPPGGVTMLAGCQVFPQNNAWNQDVSTLPVHPNSANFMASINSWGKTKLHPDFGSEYGIPFITVPSNQPNLPVNFVASWADESDPGPGFGLTWPSSGVPPYVGQYPIPLNAPIEGGGDRHVLVLKQSTCLLYEIYRALPGATSWTADNGAIWDLNSNALRPAGWTSADAAGLPILPGLVRYDEVKSGQITHALRFTVSHTQKGYILPATHWASSSTNPNYPPMGLRLRIKSDVDLSGYTGDVRVILEALKKYGMIVADNGSDWYITGALDPRWDDEALNPLKNVPSSWFEVVNTGPIVTPSSGFSADGADDRGVWGTEAP